MGAPCVRIAVALYSAMRNGCPAVSAAAERAAANARCTEHTAWLGAVGGGFERRGARPGRAFWTGKNGLEGFPARMRLANVHEVHLPSKAKHIRPLQSAYVARVFPLNELLPGHVL